MILSQSIEDYLKTIYLIESENEGKGVSTTQVAEALNISSASVTNMIKKLSGLKLVDYESYYGARLTEPGRKIALEVIRHHRLLELYLKEMMGYSWDQVHDEAEKLEHHISEQFEDRIAELLDHPTHDPHGDPIPSKDGVMPETANEKLTDAIENKPYLIGRVRDQDPDLLRYLEKIGLIPGVKVELIEKAPFKGPITLNIEGKTQIIGHDVAEAIFLLEA